MPCLLRLRLQNDRLYSELSSDNAKLPPGTPHVTLIKLPQSVGVVPRSTAQRRAARHARIREYFYGSANPERKGSGPVLSPAVMEVKFSDVKICKVGGSHLSGGLLPVGQASMLGPTRVTRVQPTQELTHAVLAVCHPVLKADGTVLGADSSRDSNSNGLSEIGQEIIDSNAAGFVFVTEVDVINHILKLLTPCPGGLPSEYLLLGSITWEE